MPGSPILDLPNYSSTVRMSPYVSLLLSTSFLPEAISQGTDVQITIDPNNLPQNEPSIAVNPTNSSNLVAAANDYRIALTTGGAWLGYYSSRDGGHSWSNNLVPGFPGDTIQNVLTSFSFSADPAVAYDNQGNAYLSGIAFNVRGNNPVDGSVIMLKSTDGGVTFAQTTIVAQGSGAKLFHDKSYLAVDRSSSFYTGSVYISWTKFTTTTATIQVSYSRNGGLTFSSPTTISVSGANQGSVPAVGPNGEVYVAWLDFVSNSIRIARSTDGGVTFTTRNVQSVVRIPSPLPNTRFRTNSFPTLAVDPANGNVYIAWADNRNGNADILFTRSTDGGLTWTSPLRVNDDATTRAQFFPWMTVSNAIISLAFYDRRDDPADHDHHLYYARSSDGGVSLEPNTRVSDFSINPDINFQGQFIGDYIGITSNNNTAYPVWTDSRNSNQDLFTDLVPLNLVHDIAVTGAMSERAFAYAGVNAALDITVTVANLGNVAESVNVTVRANATTIGTIQIPVLPPGANIVLTFSWNTSTAAKGSYTILATAIIQPVDSNLTNNTLLDGMVQVRFTGDVNVDGRVDIVDLATVGASFGSTPSTPGWNPEADINNDSVVNIVDLAIVAANFGAVDP